MDNLRDDRLKIRKSSRDVIMIQMIERNFMEMH